MEENRFNEKVIIINQIIILYQYFTNQKIIDKLKHSNRASYIQHFCSLPFGEFYEALEEDNMCGSPKAVSLMLMSLGYVGIKYPSGTRWAKPMGAKENGMNYVIFNANNAQIIKKEQLQ